MVGNVVDRTNSVLLQELNQEIVACRSCPRLVEFREGIAREKRKQFRNSDYWGRPVPGFGVSDAELIVIGLAPAAHGGNRTGRVFTGDASAKFLMKHLYRAGFSNQPTSDSRDDGLKMKNCYVTAALRCVPPNNKPTTDELLNCSEFLTQELGLLRSAKAILVLGKIAFDSVVLYAKYNYLVEGSFAFEHGKRYSLAKNFPVVFASYHPSPRNTQTGKMTDKMFSDVIKKIRAYLAK